MLNEETYEKIYNSISNPIQNNALSKLEKTHIAAIKAYGGQTSTADRVNRLLLDINSSCGINNIKGFVDEQRILINKIKSWLKTKFNELPLFEHLEKSLNGITFKCNIVQHPVINIFDPILSKINIYDNKYNSDEKLTDEEIKKIKEFQPIYGGANSENIDVVSSSILRLLLEYYNCYPTDDEDRRILENKLIYLFLNDYLENGVLTPIHAFSLYVIAMTSMCFDVNTHYLLISKLYKIMLSKLHNLLNDGPILRGAAITDTFNYELYYVPSNDISDEDRNILIYTAFNDLIDKLVKCKSSFSLLQIDTNVTGNTKNETIKYLNLPDRLKEHNSNVPDKRELLKFYLASNNYTDDAYGDIFVNLIKKCHYYGVGTIILPTLYPDEKKTIKQIINAFIYKDESAFDVINDELNNKYLYELINTDNQDMLIDSLCTNWRVTYD